MNDPKLTRILVMTAVTAEQEAVIRGFQQTDQVDVLLAGVGVAEAAMNTTKAILAAHYDLVISMGIGGGFEGIADVGSIVVASEMIAADLGAESEEGFISLEQLGLGKTKISTGKQAHHLYEALIHNKTSAHWGPILTVSTVTGSQKTASNLAKRIPGAAAEAMEGFGVAVAAQSSDIPVIEIRAISNSVGPRDRSSWKIKEALQALTRACSIIKEAML